MSSDWKKLTFYYYADHYVNFNELVTELFKTYKTRIWMSAINPASFASPATQSPVTAHGSSPGMPSERRPAAPRPLQTGVARATAPAFVPYPYGVSPAGPTASFPGSSPWGPSPLTSTMPGMPYQPPNFYPPAFHHQAPTPAAAPHGQADADLSRLMQNMSFGEPYIS